MWASRNGLTILGFQASPDTPSKRPPPPALLMLPPVQAPRAVPPVQAPMASVTYGAACDYDSTSTPACSLGLAYFQDLVAANADNDADRLFQRALSPLVTCFGYTAPATCDSHWASDKCAWDQSVSPPECAYKFKGQLSQDGALAATISGSCATSSQSTACQWGYAVTEAIETCGTATSKARCNSDMSCVWSKETCTATYFAICLVSAKLGGNLAKAAVAQDDTCRKLSSFQACVAEPLSGGPSTPSFSPGLSSPSGSSSSSGSSSGGATTAGTPAAKNTGSRLVQSFSAMMVATMCLLAGIY